MKRTLPDRNQAEVVEALERCGFVVISLHNVPAATQDKSLQGLPDLLAIQAEGLTLIGDFNQRQVLAVLQKVDGLIVLRGAAVPVEVKVEGESLRPDQVGWWARVGLYPLVLRSAGAVFDWFGRRVSG